MAEYMIFKKMEKADAATNKETVPSVSRVIHWKEREWGHISLI